MIKLIKIGLIIKLDIEIKARVKKGSSWFNPENCSTTFGTTKINSNVTINNATRIKIDG